MKPDSTKSTTTTADRIVSREVDGEEKDVLRVPISSTTQDRDGDKMTEAALESMAAQIRKQQPLVFQNHGMTGTDKPLYDQRDSIGTQVDADLERAKGDADDVELTAFILPDPTHPEGERMMQQVEQGQAVKFSVGFSVKEAEPLNPEDQDDDRRKFIDVDIMETSKVGIPSNPDATADYAERVAKSAGSRRPTDEDLADAVEEVAREATEERGRERARHDDHMTVAEWVRENTVGRSDLEPTGDDDRPMTLDERIADGGD